MDKEEQIEIAQEGWNAFTKATTYGIIGVVSVLVLMALFLI